MSMEKHTVYGGIFVDVVEDSLPRVQKILAGVKGGWQQAVGSAIKRAADAGKTVSKKAVTSEYTITQSTYLRETRNINHFEKDANGNVSVVFGYAGHVLPLLKFNTTIGKDDRVSTQIMRHNAKAQLDHAFKAQMGGHTGIYERVGKSRFPVKELYGPATPQMMYSNENVLDEIETKMVGAYEARIEHEILRVLNGWGG